MHVRKDGWVAKLLVLLGTILGGGLLGYGVVWIANGGVSVGSAIPTLYDPQAAGSAVASPLPERRTAVLGMSEEITSSVEVGTSQLAVTPLPSAAGGAPAQPTSSFVVGAAITTTASPDAPQSSPTVVPTEQPTATIAPSPTPVPATPTSQIAAGQRFVDDAFNSPSSGWLVRTTPDWSADYVDGRYQLSLTGQSNIGVSLVMPAESYQLDVDVTIDQGSAGVVFLAAKPATFYRLLLTVDGTYAIQSQQNETITDVILPTTSEALRRGAGQTNRLRIERRDQVIRFYANGESLIELVVPDGNVVNQYGFALAAPDGQGRATFDNVVGADLAAAE